MNKKNFKYYLVASVSALLILAGVSCEKEDIILVNKNISIETQAAVSEYRLAYNDTIPLNIVFNKDEKNNALGYTPKVKVNLVNANGKVFFNDGAGNKREYFTNFMFECQELDSIGSLDLNVAVTSVSATSKTFSIITEVMFGEKIAKDTAYVNINNNEKFVVDVNPEITETKVNEPVELRLFVNNTEGDGHTYAVTPVVELGEGTFDMDFPAVMNNNTYLTFRYTPTKSGQHAIRLHVEDRDDFRLSTFVYTSVNVTENNLSMSIGQNSVITQYGKQIIKSVTISEPGYTKKFYFRWKALKGGAVLDISGEKLAENTEYVLLANGDTPKELTFTILPNRHFENEYEFTVTDDLNQKASAVFYVYNQAEIITNNGTNVSASGGAGYYNENDEVTLSASYDVNNYIFDYWENANGEHVSTKSSYKFNCTGNDTYTPHVKPREDLYFTICSSQNLNSIRVNGQQPTSYTVGPFKTGDAIILTSTNPHSYSYDYGHGTATTYWYWYRTDASNNPLCSDAVHNFKACYKMKNGCYEYSSHGGYTDNNVYSAVRKDAY